jgi:hypothetical protein
MKITGPGAKGAVSGSRRADKSDRPSGAFKSALIDQMESMEGAHAVETPVGVGGVDALLMVQQVGDALEHESRKRLVRRGETLLDGLEELRHGLLMGDIPQERMQVLAQSVRTQRETCDDPRLAAILDDIELRVEVELAKLSRRS